MKKILVPTDFSPCADKALQYALTIAEKAGAEIILLHACNLNNNKAEDRYPTVAYNKPITQTAATKLEVLKKHINQSGKVTASVQLFDGDILDSIQEAETKHMIDLIVMGTQGASGFKKIIMGSKTAAAIKNAKAPVIAIPADYTGTTIRQILLATNQTEKDLTALEPLFNLVTLFNANLRMVIYSDTEEAVTYISDRRTLTGMQYRLQEMYHHQNVETDHLTGKDFEDALQAYIDQNNIDLLVMITHTRTGIEGLFHKSQTRQMAYHTTIPLLSIHQ